MRLHAAPLVATLLGCLLGLESAWAAENQPPLPAVKPAPTRDVRPTATRGGDPRPGGDAKELVDAKAKVKAQLTEAINAGNLWTVLQLEAYSVQRLGERKLVPLLRASEIIGDPLFAFPHNIIAAFDRGGDSVGVVSGVHYYQIAPDGRPLALPVALPFVPQRCALSADAKMLALFSIHQKAVNVAVRNLANGGEALRIEVPLREGEWFRAGTCVAEDGSAVLLATDGGKGEARLLLASGGGKSTPFTEYKNPRAVGAGGAWLIAEPGDAGWGDHTRVLWRQGQDPVIAQGGAALGPGMAALLIVPPLPKPADAPAPDASADGDGKIAKAPAHPAAAVPPPSPTVLVVKPDGTTVALNLEGVMTRAWPRIDSIGRWLVVGAGQSQNGGVDTDAFGNVIQAGGAAYTTLCWRWKDLLADPSAPPAFKLGKSYNVRGQTPGQVVCWSGPEVSMLDLTGDEPVERPLFTAAAAPEWIGEGPGGIMLHLAGHRQMLCDDQGHQLWNGDDDSELIGQPWPWALVAHGPWKSRTYDLLRLDPDPARSSSQKMPLPPGPWELTVEPARERVIAVNSGIAWSELDLLSLMARRSVVKWSPTNPPPEAQTLGYAISPRFRVRQARLLPGDLADAEDAPAHWSPRDACHVGQALLVLDLAGRVLISAKKKAPFQLLGYSESASGFGLHGNDLCLLDGDDHLVTAIVQGPTLLEDFPARLSSGEPLGPGPLRVSGLTFAGPHGGVVTWEAKVGFSPHLLRSQAGSPGLLVVTDSLLIDLDPAVVGLVSAPERALAPH